MTKNVDIYATVGMKKTIKCSMIHHQKKHLLKVGSKEFYYILVFSQFSEH
jgi:hypothetical protein